MAQIFHLSYYLIYGMKLMNNIFTSSICFIICLSFCFAMCTSCIKNEVPVATVNDYDRMFINTVSGYNMSQVELGNMAIAVGQPVIQALGNRMVHEHTDAQSKLIKLSSLLRHNISVVPAQQPVEQLLAPGTSEIFDSLYIQVQRANFMHIKTTLQQELVHGMQQDVKNYAADLLEEVNGHSRYIDDLTHGYN